MLLVRELVPYWSSSREVLPASNGSRGSALGAQSRPSGSCRSRQQLPFLLLLLLYGRRSGGTTALARAPRALPARPLNLVLARLHLSPPANRSPGFSYLPSYCDFGDGDDDIYYLVLSTYDCYHEQVRTSFLLDSTRLLLPTGPQGGDSPS